MQSLSSNPVPHDPGNWRQNEENGCLNVSEVVDEVAIAVAAMFVGQRSAFVALAPVDAGPVAPSGDHETVGSQPVDGDPVDRHLSAAVPGKIDDDAPPSSVVVTIPDFRGFRGRPSTVRPRPTAPREARRRTSGRTLRAPIPRARSRA